MKVVFLSHEKTRLQYDLDNLKHIHHTHTHISIYINNINNAFINFKIKLALSNIITK